MKETDLPDLTTVRLDLIFPRPAHAAAILDFFVRNETHLRATDPPRPAGFDAEAHWVEHATQSVEQFRAGRVVRWLLRQRAAPGVVIGRVNLTEIVRGPFQSCLLGYQIDAAFEGQGLMHEALMAAIDYAFGVLRLHRIEANHLPENARSAALLARLGFQRIGLAPNYLFINGAWRDHVLNQKLNPEFDPAWIVPTNRTTAPPATPR